MYFGSNPSKPDEDMSNSPFVEQPKVKEKAVEKESVGYTADAFFFC